MTTALKTFETAWLAQSSEEEFYFELFPNEPKPMRRSSNFPGALASLVFGHYQGLDHEWIEDERAVWLGMIASDQPGQGRELLLALQRSVLKLGLVLIGTPAPLRPRDWPPDRYFDHRAEPLILWYLRLGFRVVQSGHETRVIYPLTDRLVRTTFTMRPPEV